MWGSVLSVCLFCAKKGCWENVLWMVKVREKETETKRGGKFVVKEGVVLLVGVLTSANNISVRI